MITFPKENAAQLICEVDLLQTLQEAKEAQADGILLKNYKFANAEYPVNIASDKYQVFNRSRTCACCGVVGNRLFLANYEENRFNFQLFAEVKDRPESKEPIFVLMTKDHILPKSQNGTDEFANYQCLCAACNFAKEMTGLDLQTLRNCRRILYNIYRNSRVIDWANEDLIAVRGMLLKSEGTVQAIDENLAKARTTETQNAMLVKKQQTIEYIEQLQALISQVQLDAQLTGQRPGPVPIPKLQG